MYKSHCAVVTQFDRTWTWLSCREHITFAHQFHQAELSALEVRAATDALLQATGLTSCADLKTGTDVQEEMAFPGLSGGQRRRLSLAVALAKKPALLLADEPTSGLDSAAAVAIMKLLGTLAREASVAVVATIHQPGARVFEQMGELLLLTKGCTAYCGPAGELMGYLDSLGKPVPAGVSVSEHALDLVNADFSSDAAVDAVIDQWKQRAVPPLHAYLTEMPTPPARPAVLVLVRLLLQKHTALLRKDTTYLLGRMILFFMLLTLYGIYLVDARQRHQEDVLLIFYSSYFAFIQVLVKPHATVAESLSRSLISSAHFLLRDVDVVLCLHPGDGHVHLHLPRHGGALAKLPPRDPHRHVRPHRLLARLHPPGHTRGRLHGAGWSGDLLHPLGPELGVLPSDLDAPECRQLVVRRAQRVLRLLWTRHRHGDRRYAHARPRERAS